MSHDNKEPGRIRRILDSLLPSQRSAIMAIALLLGVGLLVALSGNSQPAPSGNVASTAIDSSTGGSESSADSVATSKGDTTAQDANSVVASTTPTGTPTTSVTGLTSSDPRANPGIWTNQNSPGSPSQLVFNSSKSTTSRGPLGKSMYETAQRDQNNVDALLTASSLASVGDIRAALSTGKYRAAWIDDKQHAVLLEPRPVAKQKKVATPLLAFYPTSYASSLIREISDAGLDVKVAPTFALKTTGVKGSDVWTWIILLLVVVFIVRSARKNKWKVVGAGGPPTSSGTNTRHNKKNETENLIPDTRFSDVAGVDEAVEEMRELVQFLKEPERFEKTGAKPPRGALMTGPPGTGKTLLARAVAGEAGVPFFACTGSDFVEMYVGVGAKRVRELFDKARAADKAIVFIDEVDAVARRRGSGQEGGTQENENTLVALLAEMDGFVGTHVIVLAATNRSDILDPAITRPGRLDRKISVNNPDRRGRQRILEVHAKGKPLATDVDFVAIARRTPGLSGADIALLVNEACLEASRRDMDIVDASCFDAAVATTAMGRARTSALVTESDRTLTAWHEAGHTICALLQPDADDPVSVSIVPRGPAGGVTWMSGNDDVFLPRKKALARLVTALGGRAAEEMLLDGSYTQGAHGDLEQATNLAMAMATQYGMTRLGLMVRTPQMLAASGMTEVTEVVEELLEQALVSARALLLENQDIVQVVVRELLDKETLVTADINEIHTRVVKSRRTRKPVEPLEDIDDDQPRVRVEPSEPSVPSSTNSAPRRARPQPVKRPQLELAGKAVERMGRIIRGAARKGRKKPSTAR